MPSHSLTQSIIFPYRRPVPPAGTDRHPHPPTDLPAGDTIACYFLFLAEIPDGILAELNGAGGLHPPDDDGRDHQHQETDEEGPGIDQQDMPPFDLYDGF